MKADMDKIIFERRIEIGAIIVALETYLEEHEDTAHKETVEELLDKLEVMHMSW